MTNINVQVPAVQSTLTALQNHAHQQATTSNAVISLDQLLYGIGGARSIPPTRDHIALGIYGSSGTGKSTEMDTSFQDGLVVKHAPTVTLPYYSLVKVQDPESYERGRHDWLTQNKAWENHPNYQVYADYLGGLAAVERTTGWKALLAEFDIPPGASMYMTLEQLKYNFQLAFSQGYRLPVTGIVPDEFTEMARIVYNEFKVWFPPKKYTGTIFDEVPAMNAHEQWLRSYIADYRSMGLLLGAVCQEAPLTYDDDKTSHFYGKIKYKMGPRMPFGRERSIITEAMDVMVRLYLEDGAAFALPPPPPPPPPGGQPTATPAASAPSPVAVAAPVVLPNGQSRVWPIPLKPIPTYSPRFYWTEATREIEAKWRSFAIKHREPIGLRAALVRASCLSS